MDIQRDNHFDIMAVKENTLSFVEKFWRRVKILSYELQEFEEWKRDPNVGEEVLLICRK